MIHELKIFKSFADAIISGDKTFEVRHNDRGFQKGDKVRFKVEDHSEKVKIIRFLRNYMKLLMY